MKIDFRRIIDALNREWVLPGSGAHAPPEKQVGANTPSPVTHSLFNDEYISPHPSLSPLGERVRERGTIRWAQQLFTKKQALKTARTIIAKVELLAKSTDNTICSFFNDDLPMLVAISQKYPEKVRFVLNEALDNSPTRGISEPWYRLVQVACGDAAAILPAIDNLC